MVSLGLWDTQAPEIAAVIPEVQLEVVPELDSTNSELMRRARTGRLELTLLVARNQSAGRGRMGRQWSSQTQDEEGALTFSLGVCLRRSDWSGLSLAVGVSVAQSLRPDVKLKWPNDLWWQNRKLGGILIETLMLEGGCYVVIGVGINVAAPQAEGLSTAPAWLNELEPGLDAPTALKRIAKPLIEAVRLFETQGFTPFRDAFSALDALSGREVTLSDGSHGVAAGVDARGALLVHTSAGLCSVDSAEVSVRPLN